jgi:hypothetical protein
MPPYWFVPLFWLNFSYTFTAYDSYSEPEDPLKIEEILKISMDSDAVFHEESEYVIGFKIRTTNDELSSIFWKRYFLFFGKNAKNCRKSIWPVFLEKQARTGKVLLPKWSAQKNL